MEVTYEKDPFFPACVKHTLTLLVASAYSVIMVPNILLYYRYTGTSIFLWQKSVLVLSGVRLWCPIRFLQKYIYS